MSIDSIPEADSDLYFALAMAELEVLADRVLEAGPTVGVLGSPVCEAGFLDWSRRYMVLDSAAGAPPAHIPVVDVFEGFPVDFHRMWADAGQVTE
jgi:hypothetical protein